MSEELQKVTRNQLMECCKMVAAVFVVFIHAQFPGEFGELVLCLGRAAVLLFFCISGYFNFGADCRQVQRRLKRIAKMAAWSMVIYIMYNCAVAGVCGLRGFLNFVIPDTLSLVKWCLFHVQPYAESEHLWYLMSLLTAYAVFGGIHKILGWRNHKL